MVTTAFYSAFSLGGRYIIESKNRLGAVALANEKMEIIRNLKYDDIGIVGGVPSGNIAAEEDVIENKRAYHIKTFMQYVDDPFDGISPTDADYKRVKVTVFWTGPNGAMSEFSLISRFVPPGIEQGMSGGALSINIIGSDGVGIPQSSVHITNNEVSPAIDITAKTDNTGNLTLLGMKQSTQKYDITVSKDGYEAVNTIDPFSVTYTVIDTPASVVEGLMNTKTIIQDKVIDLKIIAEDYLGNALANVSFNLEGGRVLGSDLMYQPPAAVYNYSASSITDTDGKKEIKNISPGQFFLSAVSETLGDHHTLIGPKEFTTFDAVDKIYAFVATGGGSKEIKIRYANNNDNSLLAQVVDQAGDNIPIKNAQVNLLKSDGNTESVTTMADGVAFFPTSGPLTVGTYDLIVTADGYADYNGTVNIDQLTSQQIKLTAN